VIHSPRGDSRVSTQWEIRPVTTTLHAVRLVDSVVRTSGRTLESMLPNGRDCHVNCPRRSCCRWSSDSSRGVIALMESHQMRNDFSPAKPTRSRPRFVVDRGPLWTFSPIYMYTCIALPTTGRVRGRMLLLVTLITRTPPQLHASCWATSTNTIQGLETHTFTRINSIAVMHCTQSTLVDRILPLDGQLQLGRTNVDPSDTLV
jgi:hypothetical protein